MIKVEDLSKNNFRQANDPETPIGTLVLLLQSSNDLLRDAVVLNQSTPDYIIERLLNDTSEHVSSCLRKRGLKPSVCILNVIIELRIILATTLLDKFCLFFYLGVIQIEVFNRLTKARLQESLYYENFF